MSYTKRLIISPGRNNIPLIAPIMAKLTILNWKRSDAL